MRQHQASIATPGSAPARPKPCSSISASAAPTGPARLARMPRGGGVQGRIARVVGRQRDQDGEAHQAEREPAQSRRCAVASVNGSRARRNGGPLRSPGGRRRPCESGTFCAVLSGERTIAAKWLKDEAGSSHRERPRAGRPQPVAGRIWRSVATTRRGGEAVCVRSLHSGPGSGGSTSAAHSSSAPRTVARSSRVLPRRKLRTTCKCILHALTNVHHRSVIRDVRRVSATD